MSGKRASASPLRLVSLFVVIGLGSLAVLTYATVALSDRAVRKQSEERVRATTAASAALVREELVGGGAVVEAYARRRLLASAVSQRDVTAIRRHLHELQASGPGFTTAFVADPDGVLLDIVPPTPGIVGDSFAFRDWFQGVMAADDTYVSEAYISQAAGSPLVVGIASPIRDDEERTVGILVGGHAVSEIQAFVDGFAKAQAIELTVTDQRGQVLAAPGGPRDLTEPARPDEGLASALAGRFAIKADADAVSGYAPVEGVGWTVAARVPRASVFRGLSDLRETVFTIASLLALVVVAGATLMARSLRRAADAEADVRRNAEELATARDEAVEASRLKSTFLANMSHEIRTPMNGVMGMTSLLADTSLDARQRDYVETIRSSSDALLTVVNDILDFSKIEAGRLEIERIDFDLASVVDEVGEVLGDAARRRGLELTLDVAPSVPPLVSGDPGRIRQVLTNLVSNAIKFTERGSVDVCVQRDGDGVRFAVADTGIGMSADQLAHLFDPFRQGDASTTRRYGGTGLGLAISRQLVELMGGEIHVESVPGEGTRFTLVLPMSSAEGPSARSFAVGDLRGASVLVVDDNAVNLRILSAMLGAWAAVPEVHESPAAALARFDERVAAGDPFDVVLLDFHMPEMDGLQLARTIRLDRGSKVPILLLSSAADDDFAAMRAAGIDAALPKPARRTTLYNTIRDLLGREPQRPEAAPPIPRAPSRSVRVLVVDDNAVNQRIAVHMLEKHGHRADVAANGQEALRALEVVPYDLVLMDCQMPEMDGFEATAEIRRRELGRDRTAIVGSTASAMREEVERCFAAGMDAVLPKPIREEDLLGAVDRWAPAAADQLDAPDLLDDDRLRTLVGLDPDGSRGVLGDLLATLQEGAETKLAELHRAARDDDARALAAAAHTLRGSGLSFGLRRVADVCAELEAAGKSGHIDHVSPLIDELDRVVPDTMRRLPQRIDELRRSHAEAHGDH